MRTARAETEASTPFEITTLTTFVRWLYGETGRPESDYTHECMELFSQLLPLLPGPCRCRAPRLTRPSPDRGAAIRARLAAEAAGQTPRAWIDKTFPNESAAAILELYRPTVAPDALQANVSVPALDLQQAFQELCRALVRRAVGGRFGKKECNGGGTSGASRTRGGVPTGLRAGWVHVDAGPENGARGRNHGCVPAAVWRRHALPASPRLRATRPRAQRHRGLGRAVGHPGHVHDALHRDRARGTGAEWMRAVRDDASERAMMRANADGWSDGWMGELCAMTRRS